MSGLRRGSGGTRQPGLTSWYLRDAGSHEMHAGSAMERPGREAIRVLVFDVEPRASHDGVQYSGNNSPSPDSAAITRRLVSSIARWVRDAR